MNNKLNKYNQKRDFNKTKEPLGKEKKTQKKLKFVIQHHLASRDHFDFRLEWEGILKSWAIPKGPTINPNEKRLAVLVEDHPVSYRNFEGVIPKGQYGGGIVMIWDEGYWEPIDASPDTFHDGKIKFTLYGKRLKGNWSLVQMDEKNWLLIKENDEYCDEISIVNKYSRSIRTNRTMEEIENSISKK